MALPIPIKTWEYKTNVVSRDVGSEAANSAEVARVIKNTLTDTVVSAYNDGAFTEPVAGTCRYTVGSGTRFLPGFVGDLTGKRVAVVGQGNTNDGTSFSITAQDPNGTWIEYLNGSGIIAENLTGSLNVYAGDFTTPWTMVTSAAGPGDFGVDGDGVDRIADTFVVNSFGNASYYTIVSVNGSVIHHHGRSNGSGVNGAHMFVRGLPSQGGGLANNSITGATDDAVGVGPTAEDGVTQTHIQFHGDADWYQGESRDPSRIHCLMSDDGQQTRLFACMRGLNPLWWIDARVEQPHPQWVASGIEPTILSLFGSNSVSDRITYGTYNDNANCWGTPIPEPNPPSPDGGLIRRTSVRFFMTSEGYGAAANGQNLVQANELSGEWPMMPIGLVTTELGIRGRLGQLPDMWWVSTAHQTGEMIPNDESRQFVIFNDMAFPWNGDVIEIS